jgi:OPA family glycerol-3-phosphate transporter-like MFS transporter/OPA family sugar phosphate sensor protein UhpC-like MFS transporter
MGLPTLEYGAEADRVPWLPRVLRPRRSERLFTDPVEIRERYAHFRPRILLWTTLGYGIFYFVRKNLSVAMPVMNEQLGIGKSQLGLILTLHGLLYGLSKFLNGMVADRADARVFMPLALIVCAALNLGFGASSTLVFFGLFWMLNGWFQGMGFPPCARLMSHWFGPKELATKMSFWNASHALGGGGILILCGYLVTRFGDWRLCFYVPAAIATVTAVLLLINLRDTPESVGLPDVEGTGALQSPTASQPFPWRRVFSNRYIWLVSVANFFVYTIRFAVIDWGPTMLKETKGVKLLDASWMTATFEVAGLAGMILTGWLTDRVCRGRPAPLCLISMIGCGASIYLFWRAPGHVVWLNTLLLMCAGFFVYGPQALIAVIVVNLATKRAAATAVGLTSLFGYASTVLSGWGLGALVQRYGWSPAFASLIAVALIGAGLFAAALPAKAHGYG